MAPVQVKAKSVRWKVCLCVNCVQEVISLSLCLSKTLQLCFVASPQCDEPGLCCNSSLLLMATGTEFLTPLLPFSLLLTSLQGICFTVSSLHFAHMFRASLYTCLSPLYVTSHIHHHTQAPLLCGPVLSVLLPLPMHCPTPPVP